ncbi:MAG: 4Fe-4S ferredoxin [Bacteroidales bacterium]
MSNLWYPIIDYNKCKNCILCYQKCKNGVYSFKNNKVEVVFPDGCITGCHGCEIICPEKAISYFGNALEIKCCNNK